MAKALGLLNVGDKLEIPVMPAFQSFLGKSIVWKIAAKNHSGYPANSVTLITDKIISLLAFDAKEPINPDANRKLYGSNKYIGSNIGEWLASNEPSPWYVPLPGTDEPPNADGVEYNPYEDKAGFIFMLNRIFANSLLSTTITIVRPTVDGGGSVSTTQKMFLPSMTEVGLPNENNLAEGSKLALFSNDTSRLAYPTSECVSGSEYKAANLNTSSPYAWSLRTPYFNTTANVRVVSLAGGYSYFTAFTGAMGIRPLCNLPQSFEISDTPNSDGNYTLSNDYTIKVTPPVGYARVPEQKLTAVSGESFDVTFDLPKAPDRIIYGLKIKTDNPDPTASIEYTHDAVGMTPGSDAWFEVWPFNEIQPVVLKPDGTEAYELDRMDMRKKKDGTPADLTGADGNVMVRFPTIYLGSVVGTASPYTEQIISNVPLYRDIDGKKYSVVQFEPWRRGAWQLPYDEIEAAPYVYLSAFNAITNSTGHLASVASDVESTMRANNLTEARFRILQPSTADGQYWLAPYFMWNVVDMLYLLFFKSYQQKLGKGNYLNPRKPMGDSCDKPTGANYNSGTTNNSMRFLWIESYYGGITYWVEGTRVTSNKTKRSTCLRIETLKDPTKWDLNANVRMPTTNGYIRSVMYGSLGHFAITNNDATSTTYLCSYSRGLSGASSADIYFSRSYSEIGVYGGGVYQLSSMDPAYGLGNRFCFFPGLSI